MRISTGYLLFTCYGKGVSRCHLYFGRDSKADREVGKLQNEKQRLLAWGGWRGLTRSRVSFVIVGEHIWFALVVPKLEVEGKSEKLSVINQGLGILGRLLQGLLLSFLHCH